MSKLYNSALTYLRTALGKPDAQFQDGQWEAIESLVKDRGQLLVVQRTGWGKSMVYFLATRLLRDQGFGPTLLVSPLLALMRNQLEAANRLGLRALKIDSTNSDDWAVIIAQLLRNDADLLLISPERLSNEGFRSDVLGRINIGLFVVDEAHCISDWGHDFRPDYRRITRVLNLLPSSVPVLATTATANNRVVTDVAVQLGGRLKIVRGPLLRESLSLQVIALPHQAARLAWLAEQIPWLPGSGIIYARTVRDVKMIARWLTDQGIITAAYYGAGPDRESLEQQLLNNEIKVLVATSALGMGFDKPDLRFVIHYQRTGSVVEYYQQVGRAGRDGAQSFGVMLSGREDDEITDYFINAAFPPAAHTEAVLQALDEADDGLSLAELERQVNLSRMQINKVVKLLDVLYPSPIDKQGSKYFRTAITWQPNPELEQHLTAIRRAEQQQMRDYATGAQCLMSFLRRALDDPEAGPCGKCSVCLSRDLLPTTPSVALIQAAVIFLKNSNLPIEPRKQWPDYRRIPLIHQAEPGRTLSMYGDAGWGNLVKVGKYQTVRFADELVEAAADLLRQHWNPAPFPTWVTAVPSLNRPNLVPDFAQRLAARLALPFVPVVSKILNNAEQKHQQNSFYRQQNLIGAFGVNLPVQYHGQPVLLVDDVVDSRWTFAVLAYQLRSVGAGPVFPLALAQATTDDD